MATGREHILEQLTLFDLIEAEGEPDELEAKL
jgi:hypothetical protein